jgi:ankyrin repeat protein
VVKELFKNDQVNVNKGYPLCEAAQRGHLQVVKELLANEQVDVNEGYPLRSAAQGGHLEVVKELLANDQVDVNVGHPHYWAAKMGHLEVVKKLLANDKIHVNGDYCYNFFLHWAIEHGHEKVVEELLTNDGTNMDWNDPSWWVTKGVHVEIVKKLFAYDKVEFDKKMHAHNFANEETSAMSPIHQTFEDLKKSTFLHCYQVNIHHFCKFATFNFVEPSIL